MTAPASIRLQRRIAASPARAFDAWLDPTLLGRFLFATPDGVMQRVEVDPREGGRFTVVERRADGEAAHYGVFLALDRPHRIVFAFSVERHDSEADPVTVTFAPDGDGCLVTLEQAVSPAWAEWADRTREGWTHILATFDGLMAAPVATACMLIRRPADDVFAAFTDPDVTTRFWFSRASGPLVPGAKVRWFWDDYDASADVIVVEHAPPHRMRIAWGDAGAMTSVAWTFTALGPDRTFVQVTDAGFHGDAGTVLARALDSTGGFNLVLAAAKAWLEHGLGLRLVADHLPPDARNLE